MIKLEYNQIEQRLSKIESATKDFKLNLPSTVGGESNLSTTSKLENLNKQINNLMTKYKEIVLLNLKDTRLAIKEMKETDEDIAMKIKEAMSKGGIG